jgi:predicted HAD superfamily Cof-like phosphohydrolase
MSLFNKQVRCPGCELKFYPRTNYVDKQFEERSSHQVAVDRFMKLGGQEVPAKPTIPSLEVRKLRAKLILEEAIETINALGLRTEYTILMDGGVGYNFVEGFIPDIVGIVDGCCDLRVVTTGTLSACGINDIRPQELVDENNLDKFKWTEKDVEKLVNSNPRIFSYDWQGKDICVVRRNDGKIIKPPSHQPPQLENEITRQSKL